MGDQYGEQVSKVFIGNLNYNTTEQILQDYFEGFGEVTDCYIVKDRETGRSKGFGFLTFASPDSVEAVQQGGPHEVDQRNIKIERAVAKDGGGGGGGGGRSAPRSNPVESVYIRGLRDDLEAEDIKEYFDSFGSVIDVHIPVDRDTQQRKNFAFVKFESSDVVDRIVEIHDHTIKGEVYQVEKAQERRNRNFRSDNGGGYGRQSRGGGGGFRDNGGGRRPQRSRNDYQEAW